MTAVKTTLFRLTRVLLGASFVAALCLVVAATFPVSAKAQAPADGSNDARLEAALQLPPDEYLRARVLSVTDAGVRDDALETERIASYRVKILEGDEKGEEKTLEVGSSDVKRFGRKASAGDVVVIVKSYQIDGGATYYMADSYRLPALAWLAGLFFLLAAVFGGIRGFTSVIGLGASILVILGYVVPKILAGGDPFVVTLVGAFAIAAVSLYLAHGFNRRTSVAFVGTLITLALSAAFAVASVKLASLYGMGSEQALYLQNGDFGDIDLRGLLLGGIMLGVLGVLDDITTAQSAVVEELKHANPSLGFSELYRRGLSVGREHIASLVNTLFLAYAGASMPLFLLFAYYKSQPAWFILNGEIISEEIVRTIVGSVCLILAVPITTAIAAYVCARFGVRGGTKPAHGHAH